MIAATVGCLSFASLGYELLITRYFSIAQWSHLSFLAVGLAMFGYAAGGTLHGLLAGSFARAVSEHRLTPFAALSVAVSALIPASSAAVKALPLDYLRFPVDPAQVLYLLLTWMLLSLPFLAAGCATSAAYAADPGRSGRIAGASLLGSALGAVAPALLLPLLEEGGSVLVFSLVALVPLAAPAFGLTARLAALGLCAALSGLLLWQPGLLAAQPSSYKTLPLLLQAPGSVVVSRQSGVRGLLEEVRSPALRFSPGLSLSFGGELPPQAALVLDGDSLVVLYDASAPRGTEFASWTHSFAPFLLAATGAGTPPLDCLVLQQDGGLAVACARAASARSITIVCEDPRVSLREARWYADPRVSSVAENPRAFVERRGASYSVVAIEDWGPSIPGMASLNVDAMLTADAFRAGWRRLGPRGVLAVSRRLVLPPSDSPRIFAELASALRAEQVAFPADHLAVLRSWDSCTFLASRLPLDETARSVLRAFAESRGFDLDYLPGLSPAESNRFSRYAQPLFAEAYQRIIRDEPGSQGFLDTAVLGDDRPFPSHTVRWLRVRDFVRATGGRAYTLLLTGEIVAGTALLQALLLSAIVLALTFLARQPPAEGRRGEGVLYPIVVLTGAAFMAAELAAIDALSVLFASPTVALAIALGGLLSFSALGGLLSERIPHRALGAGMAAAAAGIALQALLLPRATASLLPLALPLRVAAALLFCGLPGLLVGIPFPAAMRVFPTGGRARARAWSVNGCASVVASMACALLAPALGIRFLLAASAAAYAAAAVVAAGSWRRWGPGTGRRLLSSKERVRRSDAPRSRVSRRTS